MCEYFQKPFSTSTLSGPISTSPDRNPAASARPADEMDAHPLDDGCLVSVGGRHE
jgi:hypothetical protein